MKKKMAALAFFAGMGAALAVLVQCQDQGRTASHQSVNAFPSVFPDYNGIDLPPNIAPLNFRVLEPGNAFRVVLRGYRGDSLAVTSSKPLIRFPVRQWRRLTARCAGESLSVEILVRGEKGWTAFRPLRNFVQRQPIDPYLVYRLIYPTYEFWSEMGIYERDLESFSETPVLTNSEIDHACVNCHSFCNNDPGLMTLQIRKWHSGTLVCRKNLVEKINTKTSGTTGAATYPSWHPGGNAIAFSVNGVIQNFPSIPGWYVEVLDTCSDLVLYNCRSHGISTSASVSTPEFENLPAWTPDGKSLYYCRDDRPNRPKFMIDNATGCMGIQQPDGSWATDSADQYGTGEGVWVKRLKEFRYDLMRIACDPDRSTWGTPELVVSSRQTGRSISFPRVSPDGRYLMFCMSGFGYFSIHHRDADLYLLDLATRNYRPLDEVNSAEAESFHSWSSNGRWFVFSSKRMDGIRARPYISYFDSAGRARKPFLLPQKDPGFYSTFLLTYNVPELVTGKVPFSRRLLRDCVKGPARPAQFVK